MTTLRCMMISLAIAALVAVAGCAKKPPRIPYITVGVYDDACGFDLNGQAVPTERLAASARAWRGERQLAIVFVFGEPPRNCVIEAFRSWQDNGFERTWIVRRPPARPTDIALMPPMLD